MSTSSGFDFLRFRDGTSQQQRASNALNPDFFALDERSLRDLLQFARRYSATLLYFNQDDEPDGDWSGFLEGDSDALNEMVAYLKNPSCFDHQPEKKERYSRPHFALFLTFLSLLQEAQAQMNQITRRQLDFYYQQALGLQRLPGQPDQVHLLVQLEPEADQVLIPDGTLLFAGEDEEGDPVLYQTDESLLANQAQIRRLMSLHVEKEVATLAGIREFDRDTANPEAVFVKQLELAYRQAGTENTPRRYPENRPGDRKLDFFLIENLDDLAFFIEQKTGLRITAFQYLVELYKAWENPLNWRRPGKNVAGKKGGGINDYLERASGGPFEIDDPNNFDANFKNALGIQIDGKPSPGADSLFRSLDGVKDVYDLYIDYLRLKKFPDEALRRELVNQAIRNLGFPDQSEFEAMMKLRMDTLRYIEQIIELLIENTPAADADSIELNPGTITALDTLKSENKLHRHYRQGHTLSDLIRYICKLSDADFDFRDWDKSLLSITLLPSGNMTAIPEEWKSEPQKGGFTLEVQGEPTILPTTPKPLNKEVYALLPANRPGCFLKVIYDNNGPAEAPGVKVILKEDASVPVSFETTPSGRLSVILRENNTSLSKIMDAWESLDAAVQGAFSLHSSTPGLRLDDPANPAVLLPAVVLNKVFAAQLPAGRPNNFLKFRYVGSSTSPQLAVIQEEFQKEPVIFESPEDGQLIIKVRSDKTPAETVLEAWQKMQQKQGFSIEFIGDGSAGISKTDPSAPVSLRTDLETDKEFSLHLAAAESGSFLRVAYKGLIVAPKVTVHLGSNLTFSLGGANADTLIIALPQKDTSLSAILKAWKNPSRQEIPGFNLEFSSPRLVAPDGEVELIRSFSLQLPAGDPDNFLKVTNNGLANSPAVEVTHGGQESIQASNPAIADEYYKIKGRQLAQIESYFGMQAEDYFFLRSLFVFDPEKDWAYKDPAWKWRRADELLLDAHRRLFGSRAVPEIIRWKNLFVARDATQALVPGFSEKEDFPRWKTFGKVPDPAIPGEAEILETGELGFVFTSPVLSLQEGRRTLTLALAFDADSFDLQKLKKFLSKLEKVPADAGFVPKALPFPFTIAVSTEKQWVPVPDWKGFEIRPAMSPGPAPFANPDPNPSLVITLLLGEEFSPLAPLADDPQSGPWPAIKLVLNREKIDVFEPAPPGVSAPSNIIEESRRPYELFNQLQLTHVKLHVGVQGLKNLQAQTPDGAADPQKPFEPFGAVPRVSSRLFIAHPELAAQRLESVTLKPVWGNLPEAGLEAYYRSYFMLGSNLDVPVPRLKNDSFQVEMALHDGRRHFQLGTTHPLFPLNPGETENQISANIPPDQVFLQNNVPYIRNPNPVLQIPQNVLEADRYLELKLLAPDFQHSRFSGLLTLHALEGKLLETRTVEEIIVDGSPARIIQLESGLAQGLPVESFTVKYKMTAAEATAVAVEAENVKDAAITANDEAAEAAETAKNEATVAAQALADAEVLAAHALAAAEAAAPADVAAATDALNIASARVVEAAREAADAAARARAATEAATAAAEAAATATQTAAEVAAAAAEVAAGTGSPIVTAGELTVTYHDELARQLRVPDDVAAGRALAVFYSDPLPLAEPYTPAIESLSIDYTTSAEVALPEEKRTRFAQDPLPPPAAKPAADTEEAGHLLHLHPFGYSPVATSGAWRKIAGDEEGKIITEKMFFPFLPRYEAEGELYLGISNLAPPQTLSLLFQMAEGSANPDLPPAAVEWACLAGHNWLELRGEQIRLDTTNGLQNTGIVQIGLPAAATSKHTLMPAGLYWIRVRAHRHSQSLNDTIAIYPQALRATWLDQGQSFGRILPPGSIVDPQEPIPGLLAFSQPYSSFQGKEREQVSAFYRRASERLRHKQRALTMWDYEHLVLEQFPDIYRVKALAGDLLDDGAPPGTVSVVVIPDIRFRRPFNPFEPKAPQRQLKEIQDFLQRLAPPFVRVQVQNPRFDYLHLRSPVRFRDMQNFHFYADQLQRELMQFLSPWAFGHGAEIAFGREVYLSMLVNFIENRPYVDFIDQPKLILMERLASDGSLRPVKGPVAVGADGVARLRGPDIILVSSPEHTIEFLDDSIDPRKRVLSGIGYAKMDLDFKVAENK